MKKQSANKLTLHSNDAQKLLEVVKSMFNHSSESKERIRFTIDYNYRRSYYKQYKLIIWVKEK